MARRHAESAAAWYYAGQMIGEMSGSTRPISPVLILATTTTTQRTATRIATVRADLYAPEENGFIKNRTISQTPRSGKGMFLPDTDLYLPEM